MSHRMDAVLLDLDGTLIDTAPDLVSVLNGLLREDGRPQLPFALARNEVSNGAIGLIRRAYGSSLSESQMQRLRGRFLEDYARRICKCSRIFNGLSDIFDKRHEICSRWGIVTNKPQALTESLLRGLRIETWPDCVVGGDRLAKRKPDPAPLLHAAELLSVAPARCAYVGDSNRDIVAGKAARMTTVAAAYGYIRPGEDVSAWDADAIVARPRQLHGVLIRLREALE